MIPVNPYTLTLAVAIVAATAGLCHMHDRSRARRMRSHNRLADLCRNLDRVMRDTQEDENQ